MTHPAPTIACFRKGFTLIELSIVLVIIGLIAGGVVVGKDMIHAAKLRKVITEQENLQTAVMVYKVKYNAIPGDHATAQQMFGATACPDPAPGGLNYCNGNGNGKIRNNNTGLGRWEDFHVSQHLALAGLITGTYNGASNDAKENTCKPSSWSNAYWWIGHTDESGGSGPTFGQVGHFFYLADINTASLPERAGSVISPLDAYSIDAKIDDGKASTGRVMSMDGNEHSPPNLECVTNIYNTTGDYILTNSDIDCVLIFRGGF